MAALTSQFPPSLVSVERLTKRGVAATADVCFLYVGIGQRRQHGLQFGVSAVTLGVGAEPKLVAEPRENALMIDASCPRGLPSLVQRIELAWSPKGTLDLARHHRSRCVSPE